MGDPYIKAERLTAAYGEGDLRVQVLEDVTFEVQRHEVVAVMGPSGSGKTTLLSLIGGLDTSTEGVLRVDGLDLATLGRRGLARYRRERVGFVFQFFNLLPTLTAIENVEAGLEPLRLPRQDRRRRAAESLDRVDMADKHRRFPHELSGGEQQRVAVARAWAKDPPLVLADEPTGNLDEEGGVKILDLLFGDTGVGSGRTVVVVTHDPGVAARANRRLEIHGRRVIEGTAIG